MQTGFRPNIPHDRPFTSDHATKGAMSDIDDPGYWQEAQDRVLLYLKKLGIPAIRSLEIAEQAIRKAAADQGPAGSGLPVQLVMRALHGILHTDRNVLSCSTYKEYPVLYARWYREDVTTHPGTPPDSPANTNLSANLSATPPINRGSMSIKKL